MLQDDPAVVLRKRIDDTQPAELPDKLMPMCWVQMFIDELHTVLEAAEPLPEPSRSESVI